MRSATDLTASVARLRREVAELHNELTRNGLVVWTAGNVSARVPGHELMVIKPSGVSYDELSPDSMVVTVRDTQPPAIGAITATPSRITKTNHEMVPVVLAVPVSDGCGGPTTCRIVSVASSEPVDGTGDGDTAPDWELTGPLTLKLRGERAAQGTGRVYTITVECTDAAGNRSTSTITVTVPR